MWRPLHRFQMLHWISFYLDGDHTLRGIMFDLNLYAPKVRPGGMVCGDDYIHSVSTEQNLIRLWSNLTSICTEN